MFCHPTGKKPFELSLHESWQAVTGLVQAREIGR
jgi:hypothetical protein